MRFLLLFLLTIQLPAAAQSPDSVSVRNVFNSRHHWEWSLNHGFVRPTITPEFGPESAYPITGRVFDLGLGYTFNSSEKLGFTLTGKAGAYPMLVGIPPTAYSYGIDTKQYFHYVSYTVFSELAATATYRHFFNNYFVLTGSGGFGAKFVVPSWSRAGFGTSDLGSHSSYTLENTGEAKPFLLVQTGLQYKLKNSDLLGLRLSYQHSLKNVQEGSYYIASNSPAYSYGKVEVKGHQLTLGLNYTFTGYEKMQKRMAAGPGVKKRDLKRTDKQEYFGKRLGHSSAVRVYGALFFDRNTSTDKSNVIGSVWEVSPGFGLNFMREFNKDFFWEAGYNFHEYWEGLRINHSVPGYILTGVSSNAFPAHQFNLGGGYVFRRKNLVPLFYLSAGAAVGYANENPGMHGQSNLLISDPATGNYFFLSSEAHLLRTVFPMVYGGIRKDLRIRGKLFLSPAFRYHQGLLKVQENIVVYKTDPNSLQFHLTSVFMRGSYFDFSLGLKLDL